MIYPIFYIYVHEYCFEAPVECNEPGGDATYEQASNSKQEASTKYAVRKIHATCNPIIFSESDDSYLKTDDSFSASEITDSVAFPAISDFPDTETTDSVFFPVIPDLISISEIDDSSTFFKESVVPGNADSKCEIIQKSYWSN